MDYKVCSKCGRELPATTEFFHKKAKCEFGVNSYCKECVSKQVNMYYRKNSETKKTVGRISYKRLKKTAYRIYGNKCQVCGNTDVVVLEWHHRQGKENKQDDLKKIMRRVRDAGKRLDKYMLLCSNCHIHQDLKDKTNLRGIKMKEIALEKDDWQEESWAHTLIEAENIRKDPKKFERAKKAVEKVIKEKTKELKAAKKVVGKKEMSLIDDEEE